MKIFSELREENNLLDEALRSDYVQKLRILAKMGLISDDKFQILVRALGKGDVSELSLAEKDVIVRAFESMMHHIIDNKQLFQKVKSSGMKNEEVDLEEAYRHKEKDELGFNTGDYTDHVHDHLQAAGYRRTADGHYSHKTNGKQVVVASHDGKVSHAFVVENDEKKKTPDSRAFPVLILLRRKAIRNFPDGQRVGLYYSEKLDRYVSIPAAHDNATVAEEKRLHEGVGKPVPVSPTGESSSSTLATLKGIVANREPGHVRFRNGSRMKVDMLTAHALLTTYDRLSHPENKVHFDKHINKDNPSFLKMVEFAHKHYIGNNDGGGGMPQARPTASKPKSSAASKTVKKAAVKKSVKNK